MPHTSPSVAFPLPAYYGKSYGFSKALMEHQQDGIFLFECPFLRLKERSLCRRRCVVLEHGKSTARGHTSPCVGPPQTLECGFLPSVGHWVLPSRLRCSTETILPSVSRMSRVDISLQCAGTQSCTVSLSLNFQHNLHSTGPRLEHAQSQLRPHGHPLYIQAVGLAAVGTKIKGRV